MVRKSRKRGIKASRTKLEASMLNAGVKTQAAVADKIASNEHLDVSPTDTVNRAFRQENVSPATIARIAKVLNVEAYTLYLSKHEDEQLNDNYTINEEEHKVSLIQKFTSNYKFLSIFLVIIFLSFLLIRNKDVSSALILYLQNSINQLSTIGQQSLILYSYSAETDSLSNALIMELEGMYSIVKIDRALYTDKVPSAEIVNEHKADGLLTIKSNEIGRFVGVEVYFHINDKEKLIWADSFSKIELEQQKKQTSQSIIPFLNHALGETSLANIAVLDFTDISSQDKYLQAQDLLDSIFNKQKLSSAQNLLYSVIESYPNYGKAHAGLCESYLLDNRDEYNNRKMDDAQIECQKGLNYSLTDPYIKAMQAYLSLSSGHINDSIRIYKAILEQWPDNIDALSGLSNAYLQAYRQNLPEFNNAKTKSINYAKLLTEMEPDYWFHHFTFANVNYFAGNILTATQSFEKAAKLNPDEYTFTHVGLLNQCQGNFEKAKYFYTKAISIEPESNMGYEYLGRISFYEKDFKHSIELSYKSVNSTTDIKMRRSHKMWGNLGDSYRYEGQLTQSVDSYLNAIQIIETKRAQVNIAIADKIHLTYYHLMLTKIAPQDYAKKFVASNIMKLKEFLFEAETDASANARLAYSFYLLGELNLAQLALEKATSNCPGFRVHPDLIQITQAKRGG